MSEKGPFTGACKSIRSLILISAMFLCLSFYAAGQEEERLQRITLIAEELAADETDPGLVSYLMESLYDLSEDKVKINSGDEAEISRLFFLSDFQVRSLASYVVNKGRIESWYEIALVPGFERSSAEMIIPFIELSGPSVKRQQGRSLKNTIQVNTILKPGEPDSSAIGSPLKILARYRFSYGSTGGGFTMEKDQGERFFPEGSKIPDFFSGNLYYKGSGAIKNIIIGDYSARFGLGTGIGNGSGSFSSLSMPSYMAGRNDVRPYTSTDENNFLRGVALQMVRGDLSITGFLSRNAIDAQVNQSADSSGFIVESIYTQGIHSNTPELERKDALVNSAAGANMLYSGSLYSLGLTFYANRFSIPLALNSGAPYKYFEFNDISNMVFSAYCKTHIKGVNFFSEFSVDASKDKAVVTGFSSRLSDRLAVSMRYHHYDGGYTSFFSGTKGSGSSLSNEDGLRGSLTLEAGRSLMLSAGAEIIRFPWLRYRSGFPSVGSRRELSVRYSPSPQLSASLVAGFTSNNYNMPRERGLPGIRQSGTMQCRSYFVYEPGERLSLSTRISVKSAESGSSMGYAIAQDIIYMLKACPVTFWMRYSLFSTETWDSRIYLYENDLVYSFNVPALSGEGSRSYIMVSYKPRANSEVRIKYSGHTASESGATIMRDELRMQFRWMF